MHRGTLARLVALVSLLTCVALWLCRTPSPVAEPSSPVAAQADDDADVWRAGPEDPTIVSAFYLLPGNIKRTKAQYVAYLADFLRFGFKSIVFTDPELVSWFPTTSSRRVIAMPLAELRWQCAYGEAFWIREHAKDLERSLHLPGMYVLWAEKLEFVQRAAAWNPFNTTHFVWLDAGSFRDHERTKAFLRAPFPARVHLPADERMLLFSSAPFDAAMFDVQPDGLCGDLETRFHVSATAFAGTAAAVQRASQRFQASFDAFLAAGRFAGKDQDILAAALIAQPRDWARLVRRPPGSDWFYFYDLLADPNATLAAEPGLDHTPTCAERLADAARHPRGLMQTLATLSSRLVRFCRWARGALLRLLALALAASVAGAACTPTLARLRFWR